MLFDIIRMEYQNFLPGALKLFCSADFQCHVDCRLTTPRTLGGPLTAREGNLRPPTAVRKTVASKLPASGLPDSRRAGTSGRLGAENLGLTARTSSFEVKLCPGEEVSTCMHVVATRSFAALHRVGGSLVIVKHHVCCWGRESQEDVSRQASSILICHAGMQSQRGLACRTDLWACS